MSDPVVAGDDARAGGLRRDVLAGVVIVCLLVPEGMAYAQIAGVPEQTAFYAAPAGLLLYAVFGSSRQLVVAVSAAIAALSAATVGEVAPAGSAEFVTLTAALAVLAGAVSVLAGVLRLGRLSQFFSSSVLTGFVFGLAIVIAVKQVPKLLGVEGGKGNAFERLWDVVTQIGDLHGPTLAVGGVTVALLLAVERLAPRVPAALLALVGGIAASSLLGLEGHGVAVVGDIPAGLSPPALPDVGLEDLATLAGGAVGLALVAFAEANGAARELAQRHGDTVDPNRELIGVGAANIGAGLFQGFPIGASLSKSAAADRAGMRSQRAAVVAAGLTALVALFLTGLFADLPESTLGAIVIVAITGMMRVGELRRLRAIRSTDFQLAVAALMLVLVFEILAGLLAAVALSFVALITRVARTELGVLGRVPGTLEIDDVARRPEVRETSGLLMLRLHQPLFFANAGSLAPAVLGLLDRDPTHRPVSVLLDLGTTVDLDAPGADALAELTDTLTALEVQLVLAHVHAGIRPVLERAGVLTALGSDRVVPRVVDGLAWHVVARGSPEERADLAASFAAAARVLAVSDGVESGRPCE